MSGSHWDSETNPHPRLNQSHNTGGVGASNQELFSQRGAYLTKGHHPVAFGEYATDETASTMKARDYKGATDLVTVVHGTQDPCVSDSVAFALGRNNGAENAVMAFSSKDYGGDATVNLSPTLRAGNSSNSHANGGAPPAVAFAQNSRNELRLEGGDGSRAGCLSASSSAKPGQGYPTIVQGSAVRRLTPVECERLQGFPDNHTLLPYGVKQKLDAEMRQYYERHLGRPITDDEQRGLCADGPRYKAIGNSKAVPCIQFVGLQIIKELYRCY